MLKPLDIVITPKNNVALITEVTEEGHAAIEYIKSQKGTEYEKVAWWKEKDLNVVDSLQALLTRAMVD